MNLHIYDRDPDSDTAPCPPPTHICSVCEGKCFWRDPFKDSIVCCTGCDGSGVELLSALYDEPQT